jgi:hypothetical protein
VPALEKIRTRVSIAIEDTAMCKRELQKGKKKDPRATIVRQCGKRLLS